MDYQRTHNRIIAISVGIVLAGSIFTLEAGATSEDVCKTRAVVLGTVAQFRDAGKSKKSVKKELPKEYAGLSSYVDLVYDKMKGYTPEQVAEIVYASCKGE